jgi:hypothetical protein
LRTFAAAFESRGAAFGGHPQPEECGPLPDGFSSLRPSYETARFFLIFKGIFRTGGAWFLDVLTDRREAQGKIYLGSLGESSERKGKAVKFL